MTQTPAEPRPDALRLLVIAGTAELALLSTLGWWDGATFPWVGILLCAAAFAFYAWAATRLLDTEGGHVTIWIFAVLMRVALLPLDPELSAEIYRYIWDGFVQLSGSLPYAQPPEAIAIPGVASVYQPMIAEPGTISVSPPFAQYAFLAVAAAGGTILQAKLLWIGFDLGTGWLLGRVSIITGRSRRLTQLLYLWSPLLVIEVAWNANYVPIGLFALVLVVLLGRAPGSAGVATSAAALTGLFPVVAVPTITRRLGFRYLVMFVAGAALLWIPYAAAAPQYAEALKASFHSWDGMRGPYTLFEAAAPGEGARWLALVLLLFTAGWTIYQRYRPERAFLWMIGACVILAPGFRPEYALWILPVAGLRANRSWLLFTGLAMLGYAATAAGPDGAAADPVWVRLLIWLPLLVFLTRDASRIWRERVPPPKPLSEPV